MAARLCAASSLQLRSGEILGIAGVAGNGQDELVEAIVGLRAVSSGKILVDGRDITGASPRQVHEMNIAYVPADRHRFGLILSFSVEDNLVLNRYMNPSIRAAGRAQ